MNFSLQLYVAARHVCERMQYGKYQTPGLGTGHPVAQLDLKQWIDDLRSTKNVENNEWELLLDPSRNVWSDEEPAVCFKEQDNEIPLASKHLQDDEKPLMSIDHTSDQRGSECRKK